MIIGLVLQTNDANGNGKPWCKGRNYPGGKECCEADDPEGRAGVQRARETVTLMQGVLGTWSVGETTAGSIIVEHHIEMTAAPDLRGRERFI